MKKYFKSLLICILFTVVFVNVVFASQPKWTKRVPSADNNYRYYVGRGYSAKSEYDAMSEATKDAYTQALRVFGTKVKMSNEVYQTEKEVRGTVRISENVNTAVRFEDFDLIDQYIENKNGKYSVWVLYRFSKDSIQKEKDRLKNISSTDVGAIPFSVYGDGNDIKNGVLEVITNPASATVLIDNEPYGKTPLKLVGQLKSGKHKLEINNLFYDTIVEDIIIVPDDTVRVEKEMVRSKTKLNISTYPSGANVVMDGVLLGQSPIKNVEVESGKTITIELTHPETFKMIEERTITRIGEENIHFNLNKKPVIVSFETVPSDVSVYVDGKYIGKTPLKNESIVPKDRNNVVLKKEGYKDYSIELSPKGGEKIYYPMVKMEELTDNSEDKSSIKNSSNNVNSDFYGISKLYFGITDYKMKTDYTGYSIQDINNDSSNGFLLGFGFGFGYKNIEVSFDISSRWINDVDYDFTFNLTSFALKLDYLFKNRSFITPYVGVGVAYDDYSLEGDYSYYSYGVDYGNISNSAISFSFRFGLRFSSSDNGSLDIYVEKRLENTWADDYIDEYSRSSRYPWNRIKTTYHMTGKYEDISLNFGYVYKF